MTKIPYHQLEVMIRLLGEDRFRKVEEITRLRAENEELGLLLRSALWELAGTNGAKSRNAYVNDWLAERRRQEL